MNNDLKTHRYKLSTVGNEYLKATQLQVTLSIKSEKTPEGIAYEEKIDRENKEEKDNFERSMQALKNKEKILELTKLLAAKETLAAKGGEKS
jgi:hypothetical protein